MGKTSNTQPVISERHAGGLRRTGARESYSKLHSWTDGHKKLRDPVKYLRETGGLAGERRRPPAPGLPAGRNIVEISPHPTVGNLAMILIQVDKRGLPFDGQTDRLLLNITLHATEALYQRLRTVELIALMAEISPIGMWLLDNLATIGMEEKGLLLSPSGVFPVARGKRFCAEGVMDGSCYWDAATWIQDAGLEDHTPAKRRVAESVRGARKAGLRVGLVSG